MIEIIIGKIGTYSVYIEQSYRVNPWIFITLFFGSGVPLYYGYYRIARSAIYIAKGKIKKKKLDRTELKKGLIISIIAFWIPYAYVIFFGKLPLNEWVILILFIVIMGGFFIKTIKSKIDLAKKSIEQ